MSYHKIYQISEYSKANSAFIKNNALCLTKTKLKNLLTKENKNFHFRIHKHTDYIVFGDLDNFSYNFEKFIEIFSKFLKKKYNLEITNEDIMYTQNDNKEGSYHYSIPKYYGKTETLKLLHEEFQKYYVNNLDNVSKSNIDTTIYSEHWYRCPNQGKGSGSGNDKHIIKKGNMVDFIVDFIPKKSICIDDIIKKNSINKIEKNKTKQKQNTNLDIVEIDTNNYILEKQNKENDNILSTVIAKPIICKKLFDNCYKPERFDEYDTWLSVGMAIKNTFVDDSIAMELFNYFSAKGKKYEGVEKTNHIYTAFVKKKKTDGYTIATIYYFAIEDNKAKFIEIMGENTLELEPTDICRFLYAIASYKFIYKKENGKYILYCYNGKYWENDDVLLKKCLSTELYMFLKGILVDVYWSSPQFKQLKSKIDKLKSMSLKKEIIETYKEYGVNDDIKIDSKWWLLGFNNVVYDLKTDRLREYQYDDYICTTTGYDWIEPTQDEIDTMNYIIKTVMPIDEEREFYLKLLSTSLDGRALEKFILFNGRGGNGKGMINDMLLLALGNYAMIGNNGLLFETSKSGTNPEKAKLHKKRLVIFREPSEHNKFENGVIKELTGGGMISARDLYENKDKTTKELNLTLIVECNKRPLFKDEPGDAEVRRLLDINFRSSFVTNEEIINEDKYIFKANPDYKTIEFQNKYKYALIKILMETYKEYKKEGYILKPPESINNRTNAYLQMSCNLLEWFKDNYIKCEGEILKIQDVYNNFKSSEFYLEGPKRFKQKYKKKYFVEYFENNIFTRSYYYERTPTTRHILKDWKKKDNTEENY